MGPPKYPRPESHPIHVHPPRPLYRFAATALGASMWFFVRISECSNLRVRGLTAAADVPGEEGRTGAPRLEASVGSLRASTEGGTFAIMERARAALTVYTKGRIRARRRSFICGRCQDINQN